MTKIKKLVAMLLSVVLVFTSLAFSFSAYAVTYRNLVLDTPYVSSTTGGEDMIWYTFTPEVSGTYSLVSYSFPKCVGYLYTKSVSENGIVSYNGLAYAPANDPDYMNPKYREFPSGDPDNPYIHRSTDFRLTYHLDAGTKYYYSAGWTTENDVKYPMIVVLMQESVDSDEKHIINVSAYSDATLTRYNDGSWDVDKNGERYYKYNISKVVQNLTVKIMYSDGTTASVKGGNFVDGNAIMYRYNQLINHWYEDTDPRYNGNAMTVSVGGVEYEYHVPITVGADYNVKGVVVDYITGEPVSGAKLYWNNMEMAVTAADGTFNLSYGYGEYYITVQSKNALTREILLKITRSSYINDHIDEPIPIVVGDYVNDGIINGKDYAYISKRLTGDKQKKEREKFSHQLNFTPSVYDDLKLGYEI